MKKKVHPDYHEINVVMTDGSSFNTRSTWGKEGDTLKLDIDSKSHPAWTGGKSALNETEGQVARIQNRIKGFKINKYSIKIFLCSTFKLTFFFYF